MSEMEMELVPLTAAHGDSDNDDDDDDEHPYEPPSYPRSGVPKAGAFGGSSIRPFWLTTFFLVTLVGLLLVRIYFDHLDPPPTPDPAVLARHVPITAAAGRSSHESTTVYYVTDTALAQLEHYRRDGSALIINLHITHHAGTTFCAAVGRAPHTDGAPSFACMGVKAQDNVTLANYPSHKPWTHNETGPNIAAVRPFFHMISWEFGWWNRPHPVLGHSTHWEHPQLVSVYISKHPLERMLSSGSAHFGKGYPGTRDGTANETEWWRFAKDPWNNNYALRILSDSPVCCDNDNTTVADLESAQALLRRFTFVLDVHCLDANLEALAAILGIELKAGRKKNVHHKPLVERIPYPAVYEYLTQRNRRDIELYEWSKGLSLVNCEALERDGP